MGISGVAQDFFVTAPYTSPLRSTCGAGNNCALEPSDDHQYFVNIPSTGIWTISLCASSYDTRLYVGSTLCLGDAGANDDFCGLQSELTLALPAGNYHVTVEGWGGNCGDYVLDISGAAPPGGAGSTCGNPIAINSGSLPYNVFGDNTNNYGDNYSTSPCSNVYMDGDEVVYTFTAGATGVDLDIDATFSDSWGGIHVLDDCPDVATTCIASSLAGTATSASVNCVSIPAGQTYYIVISTFPSPQSVGYDLMIDECVPAGPEDNCAGAIDIACGDIVAGNTSGYNPDIAPFCGTGDGTGGGVWYEFTGTGDFVTASLCGSAFDTRIRVFTGTCPALVCQVGNDDDCGIQSEVQFPSIAGTTYYILVHGFGSAAGDYTLSITCSVPPDPTGEDCSGGLTVCSADTYTGNSNGEGNVTDLTIANTGCLSSYENQSSWYFFQAATAGNIAFEIVTAVDYDFAIWGPFPEPICPPPGDPARCSYSALAGNTGLLASAGDNSEDAGGDAYVAPLVAAAGDVFVMVIDNFTSDFTSFDLEWNLSGGSTLDCTPLPIELISFSGEAVEGHNMLYWTTATEINNDYFTIERSDDGIRFEEVLRTEGAGNSHNTLDYSAKDNSPMEGLNYYRLKQTDFDGAYSYSNPISIYGMEAEFDFIEIFPNPAFESITLRSNLKCRKNCSISIRSSMGVLTKEIEYTSSIQEIDISSIPAGHYLLELKSNTNVLSGHFLKK